MIPRPQGLAIENPCMPTLAMRWAVRAYSSYVTFCAKLGLLSVTSDGWLP